MANPTPHTRDTQPKNRLVSIITPVHDEAENIPRLYSDLVKVLLPLEYDFELIFVDDGSTDDSAARVRALSKVTEIKVRLIELSRNFGKEVALAAGLDASSGEATILIDADLQHPADRIPDFIRAWEDGAEVVIGVRSRSASDTRLKRYGSKAYYRIMDKIGDTKQVPHATDYRLLDRQVVTAFNRFTERQRITRGLIDWLGFKRALVYFQVGERRFGKPSYNLRKLTGLALDSFTAHSLLPLRIAGFLGSVITVFSGLLGLFTIVEVIILDDPLALNPDGTALLAIMLLFLVGVILGCIGILASYVGRIHNEVSGRPLYVARDETKV